MKVHAHHDRACDQGSVGLAFHLNLSDLTLRQTPFGLVVSLDGCLPAGAIGGPALPSTTLRVAVPAGTWPLDVEIQAEHWIPVTEEPVFVAPAQPLRPAVGERGKGPPPKEDRGPPEPHEKGVERPEEPFIRPSTVRPKDDWEDVEPIPAPRVVPPDPRLYELELQRSRPAARAIGLERFGPANVAVLELNPVRFDGRGRLELAQSVDFAVTYGPEPRLPSHEDLAKIVEALPEDIDPSRLEPMPSPLIVSEAQAQRALDLARALVVNPTEVMIPWFRLPYLFARFDYLIITDNQTWDPATIQPTGAVSGDVVEAFRRLADWKRSRGLSATVVTVGDIVSGQYGNFKDGSRDLQEVLRKFLKWAHEQWGVAWVVLGGDVSIIPPRRVAAALQGQIGTQGEDPPEDDTSFWTGTFLKMKVVKPDDWWPGTSIDHTLVRTDTGQVIPYDPTGASAGGGLGWYFTTTDDYSTRSSVPTIYVRVNGPPGVVNAPLQWLYEWNTIPTDLYYSSLASWAAATMDISMGRLGTFEIPYVYVPDHDWDANGNGVYGQHTTTGDLDGVVQQTDVSVGRAPVQSESEATTFVDKVIAYERYQPPDGTTLSPDWPRRMVFAASVWGGTVEVTSTTSSPPEDDRYLHVTGQPSTLIKLKDWPSDFQWQLIAEISDSDRRVLPYKTDPSSAVRGWYFAKTDTDPGISMFPFHTQSLGDLWFPVTSRWVVVHGPAEELAPQRYLFDRVEEDGSMSDQEELRAQIAEELPQIDQISRFYQDEIDLTSWQRAAAPVEHLTPARIEAAMNGGPHFVSLSGHGGSEGCCGAGLATAQGLTNGYSTFIGYADSCLTNQFDAEDAFSETLLNNAAGGAVAYIGNSRFGWVGLGDEFQRAFFHRLTSTPRHLGLCADSRLNVLAPWSDYRLYQQWMVFTLNLVGDPEMPLWVGEQKRLSVEFDKEVKQRAVWVVKVSDQKEGGPVRDTVVHLRQGEFERVDRTDQHGVARFDLGPAEPGDMVVTVSAPDTVPVVDTVTVTSSPE